VSDFTYNKGLISMKPFSPQLLPIPNIDWEGLMPLIGRANRALALYEGILLNSPNPEILLSPMTTQEAVLSSRIEGTQATLGEVLKFEAGDEPQQESKRQDIHEIINYRRALRRAEESLQTRPFNLNLLLELHSVLLDSVRGLNKGRGQFRREQNWIGVSGSKLEEAQFVPPAPETIPGLLDNWEKYYHLERPDPLVQLSVLHAQFEVIHPFLDGNGRLGRLIVPLYLYEKKLLSRPMFYLSSYLEANREMYVARLRALGRDEDAWTKWIEFFLVALTEQAVENSSKTRQVLDLYEKLKGRIIGLTHSQFAVPLLDRMFERPVFQISHIDSHPSMPSRPMLNGMVNKLKTDGILEVVREGGGRRPQVLVLAELVNLCEGREVL
jgi:Fic family protein